MVSNRFARLIFSLAAWFAFTSTIHASPFIENQGQIDPVVRYFATGASGAAYFTPDAVVLDLRGYAVRIEFAGAQAPAVIEGRDRQEARYNFFLGNDPGRWRADVPACNEVVFRGLWPGIDLVFRGDENHLSYEIVAAPGADPRQVDFRYEGVTAVFEEAGGSQRLETGAAPLIHRRPQGGQGRGEIGRGRPDDGVVADRDDPSRLIWSTYLGGNSQQSDFASRVVMDSQQRPLILGCTSSADFPTTYGAYDQGYNGNGDIVLTLMDAAGTNVIWSTFLGGGQSDLAEEIARDSQGDIFLFGCTRSPDFPATAGAYDTSYGGGTNYGDAFLAKISAEGNDLLWATFLGGSEDEQGLGLDLDPAGLPVVGGRTVSADFPTTAGAYDRTPLFTAAFIAKFHADGTALVWSTFFDAAEVDDLHLDAVGNPVLVGATEDGCPTTPGAYDESFNGNIDFFVAKLSSTGSNLIWCTYLGGTYGEVFPELDLDAQGNAVLAGWTTSDDCPTTPGAFDPEFNGYIDTFVATIDATGTNLLMATYLGGEGLEEPKDLAVDAIGAPVLTGYTWSPDFPTTPDAYDRSYSGWWDAFVVQLHPSGKSLLWSSFLGGSKEEWGLGLAPVEAGVLLTVGCTRSPDFPVTPGAYDTVFDGGNKYDSYVAKFLLPLPAPECRVVPEVLDFGQVAVGAHRDEVFSITNTGLVPLTGVVSEGCPDFELPAGGGPYNLSPGEQRQVLVRFAPHSTGVKTCAVETGSLACTDVACTGEGTAADDCWVDPIDIHFGIVLVGTYHDERFSITNTGYANLDLHIDLSEPSDSYVIVEGGGDIVLTAGQTHEVVIRFGPVSAGYAACTIVTDSRLCGEVTCDGSGEEMITGAQSTHAAAPLSAQPNPFNPSTAISFGLAQGGRVQLFVYDLQGRRVATLADREFGAGYHVLAWDGADAQGSILPSGVYLLRLNAPGRREVYKLTLLR